MGTEVGAVVGVGAGVVVEAGVGARVQSGVGATIVEVGTEPPETLSTPEYAETPMPATSSE